jgi:hypothetical protein
MQTLSSTIPFHLLLVTKPQGQVFDFYYGMRTALIIHPLPEVKVEKKDQSIQQRRLKKPGIA